MTRRSKPRRAASRNMPKPKSNPQPKQRRRQKQQSVGSRLGAYAGDLLEKGARGLFKSVTGIGDYEVDRNTILDATDPPIMSNLGGKASITKGSRSTMVTHREFVQDIVGSTSFVNTSYAINPGNSTLFPWISAIAQNYEQYVFHGCIFEYKSTSATALNSTNTALGTVIFATEYNVNNNSFQNKIQMENHEFATSIRPSCDMMHPIECSVEQTPTRVFYTRPVVNSTSADLRFVDMGNFQVATVGMQADATIGELWVTYQVELLKPVLTSGVSTSNTMAMWNFIFPTTTNVFGTATTSYGNASVYASSVTFGTTALTLSSSIYFPVNSRFILIYSGNGTAVAPVATALSYVNATAVDTWDNGAVPSSTLTSTAVGSSDTFICLLASFVITGYPVTITWNGGTYPSNMSGSLVLSRYL